MHIWRLKFCGLIVIVLCGVVLPAISQPTHLALVTDLTGSVVVTRASDSSTVDVQWGAQLYQGDQIITMESASVSILFSNNNLITLGQNSVLTISAGLVTVNTEQPVKEIDATLLVNASELMLHRTGVGEISALGGLRSGRAGHNIVLISPRNTRIDTLHPTFSWRADQPYESFRVSILKDDGIIWSGETTESHYAYPEKAPPLDPETIYFWQVEAEAMLEVVKSQLVSFEVPSKTELDDIAKGVKQIEKIFSDNPGSSSYYYVLGTYYARQGLLASAIDTFSRIADDYSDSVLAQEILGRLYKEVGLTDEAVDALQRALDLSQSQ